VNVRHGALACFRKNRTVARAGSSPARVAGGGSAPSAWATESATKDQDEAVCLTDSPRGLLAAMALLNRCFGRGHQTLPGAWRAARASARRGWAALLWLPLRAMPPVSEPPLRTLGSGLGRLHLFAPSCEGTAEPPGAGGPL
jgi:hypothetical protein